MTIATPCRGFVALIPSLVLSMMLTLAAVNVGERVFFAQAGSIQSWNHIAAKNHARSCVSVALLLLMQDPFYLPAEDGDRVQIEDGSHCKIEHIEEQGEYLILKTSAVVGRTPSILRVTIGAKEDAPLRILSWEEIDGS